MTVGLNTASKIALATGIVGGVGLVAAGSINGQAALSDTYSQQVDRDVDRLEVELPRFGYDVDLSDIRAATDRANAGNSQWGYAGVATAIGGGIAVLGGVGALVLPGRARAVAGAIGALGAAAGSVAGIVTWKQFAGRESRAEDVNRSFKVLALRLQAATNERVAARVHAVPSSTNSDGSISVGDVGRLVNQATRMFVATPGALQIFSDGVKQINGDYPHGMVGFEGRLDTDNDGNVSVEERIALTHVTQRALASALVERSNGDIELLTSSFIALEAKPSSYAPLLEMTAGDILDGVRTSSGVFAAGDGTTDWHAAAVGLVARYGGASSTAA